MRDNSFIRKVTIVVFTFLGLLIGALLFHAMGNNGSGYYVSAGVLVVITCLTAFIMRHRKIAGAAEDMKGGSSVGFVVDTFQDLVAKLKEKERELEKLKAFAEEKATSIEAYNENILQSVPSGVVSIDNAMKIKSVNQAAERILGVCAGEMIGRDLSSVLNEPLITMMKDEKAVSRVECQYVTSDKRRIWLGVTASRLNNAAGEKIGLILVFTDLTDIKALQEQVELKQRLSQLGEMSAGISHELRNSMSVISGYARLLEKKADPAIRPEINAITAEITGMDRIISELLAFAKPSVLNTEETDLSRMVTETAEAAAARNQAVRLTVRTGASVIVNADEVLLRQALSNVLVNAVEAMHEGGSLEAEVTVRNNRTEIRVSDTGQGMPEEVRQKIFLPFFTTKDKGTGLGLALAQKIIISHGGSIEVDSREGEGTTFIISLPCE